MSHSCSDRAFDAGVELKQVTSLCNNSELIAQWRPFHGSGNVSKASKGNCVGLLFNVPNADCIVRSVGGNDVVSGLMPRDAHYLFSVSQKSRIRILQVLGQASLGCYPKFHSAVL